MDSEDYPRLTRSRRVRDPLAECIANGTHLTACDEDGNCAYCGCPDTRNSEQEEPD